LDVDLSNGGISLVNLARRGSGFQHFQDLPDHHPGALEGGLPMTDLGIGDDIGIDFCSFHAFSISPIPPGRDRPSWGL